MKQLFTLVLMSLALAGCGGGGGFVDTPGNFGTLTITNSPSGKDTFTPCTITTSSDSVFVFDCFNLSGTSAHSESIWITMNSSIWYLLTTGESPRLANFHYGLSENNKVIQDKSARTLTFNNITLPLEQYSNTTQAPPTSVTINGILKY